MAVLRHSFLMTDDERIQYKFKLPAALKDTLEGAAAHNRRSLSAEIIARLQRTVDEERFIKAEPGDSGSDAYLARITEERLKLEGLLAQYVSIFKGYTPADIMRMFDDYETLRKTIEKTGEVPKDHPFKE